MKIKKIICGFLTAAMLTSALGISASAANIGCRLSGFVYNGTSLPNTIELYDNIDTNFENPIDTITAPTGVFEFENVQPGTYSIKAERTGGLCCTITNIPVTSDLDISQAFETCLGDVNGDGKINADDLILVNNNYKRESSIKSISDPDIETNITSGGSPLSGSISGNLGGLAGTITLYDNTGNLIESKSDTIGNFIFENVPNGIYSVKFERPICTSYEIKDIVINGCNIDIATPLKIYLGDLNEDGIVNQLELDFVNTNYGKSNKTIQYMESSPSQTWDVSGWQTPVGGVFASLHEGVLYVYGNGAVRDYANSYWKSYLEDIAGVYIGSGVTYLGNSMFKNCTNLKTVKLITGLGCIGPQAFMGCTSLSNITFPASIGEIQSDAFHNCKKLNYIVFKHSINQELNIQNRAFYVQNGFVETDIESNNTYVKNYNWTLDNREVQFY